MKGVKEVGVWVILGARDWWQLHRSPSAQKEYVVA